MRRAQSTASSPVPLRPPWVKTSHLPGAVWRASIATTMHWSPYFSAASRTNSGRVTAAELIETLSAPASSRRRMSSIGAHAAAHGQRHEALLGGAADDVEDGVAVLVARGDVEEGELVGAGGVVDPRLLDRIAGVAQVDELHALDRRGRP